MVTEEPPSYNWRHPIRLLKSLHRLSQNYQEEQRFNAYYTIPVLFGFVVTYVIIQIVVRLFPSFHFTASGYHIHHYTYGIILLMVFGYIGLWTQSLKTKYICALAYGVAIAFIIDEAWTWFTLNPVKNYQDYDLVLFVVAFFVAIILAPRFFKPNGRS